MKPISALLVALFLAACSPVKAGNPGPTPNKFGGMAGRVVTVHEGKEVPLTDALVTVGDRKATTDERGLWRIDDLPLMPGERVAVRISRSGYAPFVRTVDSASLAGAFFNERLLPVAAMKRVAVAEGGSIVVPGRIGTHNDAAVSLPPKFMTTTAEEVDVAVAVVRPHLEEELALFPGDFVGRSTALPKGEDQIRTLGTMEVSFSNHGEPLGDVTLNAPAGMLQHLDPKVAADFAEGATIPTWWLRPETGIWEGEGYAKVVVQNGEKYASWSVKHFTWWNVDEPLATHACVALKVNPAGESERALLATLKFTLAGVDYAGTSLAAPFVDGLAVANGWLGHSVAPQFSTMSGGATALSPVLVAALFGKASFTMPTTNASAYFKVGPGGIPLVPEKHCMYVERTLSISTGAVRGRVIDEYGAPMSGAVVTIPLLGAMALSGAAGEFVFTNVPWREDGDFSVTLVTIAPTNNPGAVFADVPLVRDEADQTVLIVADPVARPPVITNVDVQNTTPPVGGATDFTVNVADDNASLQWGLELCGRRYEAHTSAGSEDPAKVVICHYPPGNRDNPQTVSVGSASVDAHLAHGDALGACPGVDTTSPPATGADPSATNSSAELTCAGTLTNVQTEVISSAPGRNSYRLRGRWHGGATHGRETLKVLVKDPLGNVSEHRQSIYLRNNAPVVFIDAPSYPVLGETVHVVVRASDPDGDAMTYGWSVNGVARAETGGDLYVGGLAEGPNYVTITVKDGEATVNQRIVLYVVPPSGTSEGLIDSTAPDTWVLNGEPATTSSASAVFSFGSFDSDVTGFDCRLDAEPFVPCTSPYQVTGITLGMHTFSVRAIDDSGNYDSTPAFATWEVGYGWKDFSVGSVHSCAINVDSRLACWGMLNIDVAGYVRELGTNAPVTIGTSQWLDISAGRGASTAQTCGVRFDRTLWCWGDNAGAYLLGGTPAFYSAPVQVGFAANWATVEVANSTACALNTAGRLYCWGKNTDGRLGRGSTTPSYGAPLAVSGTTAWLALTVGPVSVCAVRSDRTLWCWGNNAQGQLGDGTYTARLLPTKVGADTDWDSVAMGDYHACARKVEGALYCWGANGAWQLGQGAASQSTSLTPLLIAGTGWVSAQLGADETLAVKEDGTLWAWGESDMGEFGNNLDWDIKMSPTQIGTDTDWVQADVGSEAACARKSSGELLCAGSNFITRTGNGAASASSVPILVDNTIAWTTMSEMGSHVCAIAPSGLYCWGKDGYNETGLDPSVYDLTVRNLVIGPLQPFTVIATGDDTKPSGGWGLPNNSGHSCAIRDVGYLYCWGQNGYHQLGYSTTGSWSDYPKSVPGSMQWSKVAVGGTHSCATQTNGKLYCWGNNEYWQAGQPSGGSSIWTPTTVGTDTDWARVFARQNESCALKSGGTLYCWGRNYNGIHGNGSALAMTAPAETTIGFSWSDFSLGFDNACGVRSDGTLWCWGSNAYGQIGRPVTDTNSSMVPLQVGSTNDWETVNAGNQYACAIKTTGTLWCWGNGFDGVLGLGNGSKIVQAPIQVGTDADWREVRPSWNHTCGLKTNGNMYCWGRQIYGEWGNGSTLFKVWQTVAP